MSLLCAQSSYSNYSGNTFFKERERWTETIDRLRNWGAGGAVFRGGGSRETD